MVHLPISVIIPTYNRARLIVRPVESALAAIAPGDEVIVVDDGSTDETEQVLQPYADRIRYIRAPHAGAGATRNRGVREARHPLVAFLDSDDAWEADKLTLQRAVMAAWPDVLFCFTDFAVRGKSGHEYHHYLANWHQDPRTWAEILGPGLPFSSIALLPAERADFRIHIGDLYPQALDHDYVATTTLVVRREAAGAALHFAEDLPYAEDGECYARLAGAGLAAYLDCETAWQFGHDGPRLTQLDQYTQATARLTVLERVWGADPTFLTNYAERYHLAVAKEHRRRARWLIAEGRTREARAELALAGGGPLAYRLLATLPNGTISLARVRALRVLLGRRRWRREGRQQA